MQRSVLVFDLAVGSVQPALCSFVEARRTLVGNLPRRALAVGCRTDRKAHMLSHVEFTSEGTTLRGWLYSPDSPGSWPGLVMAPGFTVTADFPVFDMYARGLADTGVAVLLFDLRGFGSSDGEPRCQINPWVQARDYHAALEALRSTDGVDADRVGVWGVSLSGAIATVAAATDPKVAAAVLLVPAFGDEASPPDPRGARFASIEHTVIEADLDAIPTTTADPMPVVSPDQDATPSLLQCHTAHPWFTGYGERPGSKWVNEATIARVAAPTPFDAQPCVPRIAAPILMVIAEVDEMEGADADVARKTFATGRGTKTLATVGGGHFGLITVGSANFERSLAAQQAFVREHLLTRGGHG
jgi:dienelactone hydrolase